MFTMHMWNFTLVLSEMGTRVTLVMTYVAILGLAICLQVAYIDLRLDLKDL